METNIFDILFSPVNMPLTIATMIMVVVWLISMFSGIDADLDFDADVDVDADLDVESGVEASGFDIEDPANIELTKESVIGNRRRKLKSWQIFLVYFNFVGVPFLLALTIFIFFWWMITVFATIITHTYNGGLGFLIALGTMIIALFLTKFVNMPLKSFFDSLNKDGDTPVDYLGRKGTSLSNINGEKLGNAEVKVEGNTLNIYIKSYTGEPIGFRDKILIIRESEDKNFFYAQKYND